MIIRSCFLPLFRRENGLSLEKSEKRGRLLVHVLNIGTVNLLCYVSK